MNVIVAYVSETCKDLCKRSHDQFIAMTVLNVQFDFRLIFQGWSKYFVEQVVILRPNIVHQIQF